LTAAFVELADLGATAAVLAIAALVAGDSLVPAVPGETATLSGAVLAARGELPLLGVFGATWLGAVVGDNLLFGLGGTSGRWLLRRQGDAVSARAEWVRRRLQERGATIILVARFIPGGRNAVSLAAGTLGMRWRSFAAWDALAAALWALCATALGYVSGRTFAGSVLVPLGLSLVVATAIGLLMELALRLTNERRGPL
jgi:membrane-associated protein